jgi:hypothetical protein
MPIGASTRALFLQIWMVVEMQLIDSAMLSE